MTRAYILFLLSLQCSMGFTQSINLPKEGRFKFGDNPDWKQQSFNDQSWEFQQLAKSFRKDSSYAWYRIRIVIPSSMKTTKAKGIKLQLGKIDDADQTFFNGSLIGETGSFPPAYLTQWEKQRIYTIPEKLVQWDKENVIAVRIYNLVGGMGMWEGPYTIEPIGWKDEVSFTQDFIESAEKGFDARILFKNKIDGVFNGTINYWIKDKAGKTLLFSETKPVHLDARPGAETTVVFSNYKSDQENVFQVGYQINDNNSKLFEKKEQLYIASSNLEIPYAGERKPIVENKVPDNFTSVPFQNISFTGYLQQRFVQNLEQRLLKVDEFGLTGSYLNRPGIHPWAGEHIGKYLETACNVWKLTHNKELKKQMDRIMYTLISTQLDNGYLGTYTPDQYWTSWDVWSHKYNLHGLLTYYATTGYLPALDACKKIGNLLCKTFGTDAGQLDIIMAGTHMGMAATSILDAMTELYKYTGDKRYLDFCYYIVHSWEQDNGPKVLSAMLATGKLKNVGNGKAYEMLSNFVGLTKLYQITGDSQFLQASEMAWQDVVNTQLYITGTSSSLEYFQEDEYLPASEKDNMGEGCVTTTWIQLNQNLFSITGDIKYLNQLEKSVYNQLLGAENPQTGCVSYYTPLMGKKPFTCYITCCQSSVPRGIALIPYFTFGNINKTPTVLFYESAVYKETIPTADNKNIELQLKLNGDFPINGDLDLTVLTSAAATFPIALRVPTWCSNFSAKLGNEVYTGLPDQVIRINKFWKGDEKIIIHFDMPVITIAGGKSYPGQYALQRGPQILALDESLNTATVNSLLSNSYENIVVDHFKLVNKHSLLPFQWIGKQAYVVPLLKTNEQMVLVPFAEASQSGGIMKVWLPLFKK